MNPMQMFNDFMKNPMQFITQRRLSIPQNLQGDPKAMVQHLLSSGQMSQETFNRLDSYRKQIEGTKN